jgi:ABC-type transport system involved in multi-copper enzyme maturation permease subunit
MGTIIRYTLWESVHRRMGLVLMVFSLVMFGILVYALQFQAQPDGTLFVLMRGRTLGPAARIVPSQLASLLDFATGPWVLLGIFAVAPLLTSFMEKGWVDLLLAKGVSRWTILLGRYLGATGVFALCLGILGAGPAFYFWARTGVAPARFFESLLVLLLSFGALAALMAFVAVINPSPALPIMFAFLQTALSPLLFMRERVLYDVITAKWAQWLMDWAYRVLPKTTELSRAAAGYLRDGKITDWWPLWSTAVFLAGTLVAAGWLFRRKSF